MILYVSEETIRGHLKHAYVKLGVRSAPSAIYRAIQDGWLITHSQDELKPPFQPFRGTSETVWNGLPEELLRSLTQDSP